MLWMLISLFFVWMIYREIRPYAFPRADDVRASTHGISVTYITLMLGLALAFAWPPLRDWRFERMLSAKATQLAETHPATVHCNTVFDTLFDSNSFAAGHAQWATGRIVFQYPWCGRLMDYLAHPTQASPEEIFSLNILTHESMHIRGEHNEGRTECQSVQRNYRSARLLGVPERIARQTALAYWQMYRQHVGQEGFTAQYFSDQCAPGAAWDEHLSDSTWAPP